MFPIHTKKKKKKYFDVNRLIGDFQGYYFAGLFKYINTQEQIFLVLSIMENTFPKIFCLVRRCFNGDAGNLCVSRRLIFRKMVNYFVPPSTPSKYNGCRRMTVSYHTLYNKTYQ